MAERESAGKQDAGAPRVVRIFCDADVLLAGSASTTGASHILLQMSELTLLKCITSPHAIKEVERNLLAKLPDALPAFRLILEVAIEVIPAAPPSLLGDIAGQAHAKDLPLLAAAISGKADFLATFNTRHFLTRRAPPFILQPRDVLARIRAALSRLLE